MTVVNIADLKNQSAMEFWAARGLAVHAFVEYEQSICRMFEALTGLTDDVARLVFFKIADRRAQLDIIEKLLVMKGCRDILPYFRSMKKQFPAINVERNQVAHWDHGTIVRLGAASQHGEIVLIPPQTIGGKPSSTMDVAALSKFTDKCGFYAEKWRELALALKENANALEDPAAPWRLAFSGEVVPF